MKQLLATLLLVGLIVAYWPWVVGFVLIVFGVRMLVRAYRVRRDERAALIRRADMQHQWAMAGDPRGTFGSYFPAVVPLQPLQCVGCYSEKSAREAGQYPDLIVPAEHLRHREAVFGPIDPWADELDEANARKVIHEVS